jgi:hypothetical protein
VQVQVQVQVQGQGQVPVQVQVQGQGQGQGQGQVSRWDWWLLLPLGLPLQPRGRRQPPVKWAPQALAVSASRPPCRLCWRCCVPGWCSTGRTWLVRCAPGYWTPTLPLRAFPWPAWGQTSCSGPPLQAPVVARLLVCVCRVQTQSLVRMRVYVRARVPGLVPALASVGARSCSRPCACWW